MDSDAKLDVPSKKGLQRSRCIGTSTRGDDATTSAGRRQIYMEEQAARRGNQGITSVLDLTKDDKVVEKATSYFEKKKRGKKIGYQHAAAQPTSYPNGDMLSMPDGGISRSRAKADTKPDPAAQPPAPSAGLLSEQMTHSSYIGDKAPKTTRPIYFPDQGVNPINHEEPPKLAIMRDKTPVRGAAGIGTERLTEIHATYLQERDASKPRENVNESTDVLCHSKKEPEQKKTGKAQFADKKAQMDEIDIAHVSGPPVPMPAEDVAKWSKMKQVRIRGGTFRYNVAGHMDLLPAATQPYAKADKPPSQSHKRWNDKKYLPKFYLRSTSEMRKDVSGDMTAQSAVGRNGRESKTPPPSMQGTRSPPPGRGFYPSKSERSLRALSDDNSSFVSDSPSQRFSPPARGRFSQSVGSLESY